MNLAYVAGIFDGEGCVNFSRVRKSAYIRVLITNTDKTLLDDIQRQFGGDVKPLACRKAGWKQGFQWCLSWSKAVDFLEKVSPWLRVKKQQAATAFAWDAIRIGPGKHGSEKVLEHRHAIDLLVDYLHWLNQKGNPTRENPLNSAIALSVARKSKRKSK